MLLTKLLITLIGILLFNKAGAWLVDVYSGVECDGDNPIGYPGSDSGCYKIGGNSWSIGSASNSNDNFCTFSSWSGNNCEGSNSGEWAGENFCHQYPFASIRVVCL